MDTPANGGAITITDEQLERGIGRLYLRLIATEEQLAEAARYIAAQQPQRTEARPTPGERTSAGE